MKDLVRPRGFEPLTYGFVVRRSIQLSYGRAEKEVSTERPRARQQEISGQSIFLQASGLNGVNGDGVYPKRRPGSASLRPAARQKKAPVARGCGGRAKKPNGGYSLTTSAFSITTGATGTFS